MLSAAVLALAACTQNDWTDSSGLPEGKYPLVIEAGGLESVASRATVDGNWEGVTDVALQVGAEVKIYTVSATGANKENAMLSAQPRFTGQAVQILQSPHGGHIMRLICPCRR